jgi:hypothetical protein
VFFQWALDGLHLRGGGHLVCGQGRKQVEKNSRRDAKNTQKKSKKIEEKSVRYSLRYLCGFAFLRDKIYINTRVDDFRYQSGVFFEAKS